MTDQVNEDLLAFIKPEIAGAVFVTPAPSGSGSLESSVNPMDDATKFGVAGSACVDLFRLVGANAHLVPLISEVTGAYSARQTQKK